MYKKALRLLCLTLEKKEDKLKFRNFKIAEINTNLTYLIGLTLFALVAAMIISFMGLMDLSWQIRTVGMAVFAIELIILWIISRRWQSATIYLAPIVFVQAYIAQISCIGRMELKFEAQELDF